MSKFTKESGKLGRGLIESTVAPIDVATNMLGMDFIDDDFYKTEGGKTIKGFQEKAMPIAAGVATGVLTGDPQLGMSAYSMANNNVKQVNQEVAPNPYQFEYGGFTGDDMQANIPKLYNIEKGELIVDPNTGDIVEDLDSHKYKPHSKDKKKEHQGNFIEIPDGLTIIPKSKAEVYRKNINLRKGLIRDINNKHADRMLYGRDADGNVQEHNKLVEQAFAGLQTGVPEFGPQPMSNATGPIVDGSQYLGFDVQKPFGGPLEFNRNYIHNFDAVYNNDVLYGAEGPQQNIPQSLMSGTPQVSKNNLTNFSINNNSSIINRGIDSAGKGVSNQGLQSSGDDVFDPKMTPGDWLGMAGTAVGGLGPLAVTRARQKNMPVETNYFGNVGDRAANQLSSVLGRGREDALRSLGQQNRGLMNSNRNASSNFSQMSARNQNASNLMQQNIARNTLPYDSALAQGLSGIMMNADMANAQGLTARDERNVANQDAIYTAYADNLANLGNSMQFGAANMNKNVSNRQLAQILRDRGINFTYDSKGKMVFKND